MSETCHRIKEITNYVCMYTFYKERELDQSFLSPSFYYLSPYVHTYAYTYACEDDWGSGQHRRENNFFVSLWANLKIRMTKVEQRAWEGKKAQLQLLKLNYFLASKDASKIGKIRRKEDKRKPGCKSILILL